MRVREVRIHLVDIPLVGNFRTSVGHERSRKALLVEVITDDGVGWGECGAEADPSYLGEFNDASVLVLRDFLCPLLFRAGGFALQDLDGMFAPVRDHQMAKAALEMAVADVSARQRAGALADLLGEHADAVPSGVAIGIYDDVEPLLGDVEHHLALGYQRVKVKIRPGWDVVPLTAVRERFADCQLAADANGAYDLTDAPVLAQLDGLGLSYIEQPLDYRDLTEHAELGARIETPICLDESIRSTADASAALALSSCRVMNVKAGRVGGLKAAIEIAEACRAAGVSTWVGGMLETGVGRAAQVALASHPLFDLPGDIGATSRYFATDIAEPPFELTADGCVLVPQGPGLGVEVDRDALRRFRKAEIRITP